MQNLTKRFSFTHWGIVYESIRSLGSYLKDGREGKFKLKEGEEEFIQKEIKLRIDHLRNYMKHTNLRIPKPLWNYDPHNSETWMSHEDFKYSRYVK